jgi:hypothetical protein
MAEEITNPSEELISPTEETASPSDEMTGGSSVATETKPSVSKVDMLWNALSKDDVYKNKVGSIDEFRTKMQNPEKAKMLWNALSKDEVYASKVGDEKTFLSKVSSPKPPARWREWCVCKTYNTFNFYICIGRLRIGIVDKND